MKIRLLTTEGNVQSAGKLGFPTYIIHDAAIEDLSRDGDAGVLIRWGHSSGSDPDRVLNSAEAIAENCNKLLSKQTLAGAVDTPAIYTSRIPRNTKAVYRPIEHSQGSDFAIVEGPKHVEPGYYASKLISTEKEYRVWFAGEDMLCARRVAMQSNENRQEANPCRSKWGYSFQSVVFPVLGKKTQAARKALSLDFGAADVLWDEAERKYYFLELNTACSLDHRQVLSFFKHSLPKLVEEKYANQRS